MERDTIRQGVKRPARGALGNEVGRYERFDRRYEPDGWDLPEDERLLRTEVSIERPRRLISYNTSPDLPFDRSINPYRGCEHGCIYCFARPTHAWLGMSAGLDFETRLVARPEAAGVLAKELGARRYRVAPIAIGTNTDPYQPIEKEHKVTRACLKVLERFRHPVAIVTKGTLIERDLDVLGPMAALGLVRVGLSITTLDPDLSRKLEPRAPSPLRRLQTVRRLAEAGVPVRVMTSPLVPGLTDHELEALLAAGAEAGALAASWITLRLPLEVSPLFQAWLSEHAPDRAARVMSLVREMHGGKDYDAKWNQRMRGSGPYAEMIARRFRIAARKHGLDRPQPALRSDLFRPISDIESDGRDQLSLF
jgi:DNA repair photolyase